MEVTGVETKQLAPRNGVSQVELVRSHNVAFTSDPKQLRFHGIQIQIRGNGLRENRIQRFFESAPGSFAIDWSIF